MNSSQKQQAQVLLAATAADKLARADNELAILHEYGQVKAKGLERMLEEALNDGPMAGQDSPEIREPVVACSSETKQTCEPGAVDASAVPTGIPLPADNWVEAARSELERGDIDTRSLSLDQFFTAEQLDALQRRIQTEIDLNPVREPWRRWQDYVVVCLAGMVAGLWELGIKQFNVLGLGLSPEDKKRRIEASENWSKETGEYWLKRRYGTNVNGKRVVLDAHGHVMKYPMKRHVIDARIPRQFRGKFGDDLHRGVGPMHDLCRMRETVEMMVSHEPDFTVRGTSAVGLCDGWLRLMGVKGDDATKFNRFRETGAARIAFIFHMLSDVVTARSLPLPGITWVADGGDQWRDRVMRLYERGVNVKNVFGGAAHLSSPVITEAILRLYFVLTYPESSTVLENFLAGGLVCRTRREREMLIVAHGIAAAVGSLRFVVTKAVWDLNGPAVLAMLPHVMSLLLEVHKAHGGQLEKIIMHTENLKHDVDDMLVNSSQARLEWLAEEQIDHALGLSDCQGAAILIA